jgi:hypothetical protein
MAGIFTPEQIGKRFMFDKEAKKELTNYIISIFKMKNIKEGFREAFLLFGKQFLCNYIGKIMRCFAPSV